MKKLFSLSMFFAFMALFSTAQQVSIIPLVTVPDSITSHSIAPRCVVNNGGALWYMELQSRKIGTLPWIAGDTGTYSGNSVTLSRKKDSLQAHTTYELRWIYRNATFTISDTVAALATVQTKDSTQPLVINSVAAYPSLPKSGLIFDISAVEGQAFAFGMDLVTGAIVTDTSFFGFNNHNIDTVFFLVDGPNYSHNQTMVIARSLSGMPDKFSSIIPAFSSPAYTAVVMNFGAPTITKDSIRVNLNVTSLGNAGNPTLDVLIKDSLSGLFVYQALQTLTATGSVTIAKGNLLSNHWYILQPLATTPQNITTLVTLPFRTLNVDQATVTVSQQLPQDYVSYTAKAFINPKGSGDSSKVVKAEFFEGNVVVDSMMLALTDTGTITFTRTGQNPGTSKSVKVRVTNGANLVTTSSTINVSMLAVGTPIMNPTEQVKTTDSLYVGFSVTGLGIPLNPTFHVVIKNPAGVIILDSTRLVTQAGIIGIGKGGLMSNTTYTITATLSNMMLGDTDVVVITTNSIVITPNTAPHITDVLADDAATARITNISYGASADNTSTIKLVFKILQAGYVDTLTVATGLIGSGIIPSFTINTCIGGYTTQVTVIDESPAGRIVGNTLQKNMPLPSDVILADIAQDDNLTTATTLAVKAFGSGEGNASPILKLWLYKNNTQIGSTFSTTVNSGMFDYSYSWDNLQPATEYKVVAELSAVGSAPSPVTRYFYTDAISGIQEIPQITDDQLGIFSNVMGQVVAKGTYRETHASLVGSHAMFFFTQIGDVGLVPGSTRKIWIP